MFRACFITFFTLTICWVSVLPAMGQTNAEGARILLVNSYHQGYDWSDGIEAGVRQVLQGSGVELKVFYMDTKRKTSQQEKVQAGASALEVIKTYKPDVVIAADDNAQQLLVVPYLLGTSLPVVFCGVNWDASEYGYPASNVTGMLEVEAAEVLKAHLRHVAKGDRLGFVSDDTVSERRTADWYNILFFNGSMKTWFCSTFEEFKSSLLQAQQESDMILLLNNAAVKDWDDDQALRFLLENMRIPTGSVNRHMADFVLFAMLKMPEEQGEWAANAALDIIGGKAVADIPITRNMKGGLIVNLRMADAMGIVVPMNILKAATQVIGQSDHKQQ